MGGGSGLFSGATMKSVNSSRYALLLTSLPLAARGLKSYRHPSVFGWVMIGATDDADALREAARSVDSPSMMLLQKWNGSAYQNCAQQAAS